MVRRRQPVAGFLVLRVILRVAELLVGDVPAANEALCGAACLAQYEYKCWWWPHLFIEAAEPVVLGKREGHLVSP